MNKHTGQQAQPGFTLVEIAMVLFIVTLLMAGLVPIISSQLEQQRTNETRKLLSEIKEALIGYAMINGRLPCPSTTADPNSANYGVTDATCTAAPGSEGYLPWKTLGVAAIDAWGIKRKATGDPWIGQWRYRVDRNFSAAFNLTTGFSADALLIKDNSGNNITTTTERPVAIVYSTGKNSTADGQNASFEGSGGTYQSDVPASTFDDIMIWVSRPQLLNRMVMAGKLP